MISRFIIFAALLFLPLAAQATATPDPTGTGELCLRNKPAATDINIELYIPEPDYDNSQPAKALTNPASNAQWLKKNNLDTLWSYDQLRTNGRAASGWKLGMDFTVVSQPLDQFGAYYCPYVMQVNIDILMQTSIQIAREIVKGTCKYESVEAHEYKHFLVNKYVIEEAVAQMERDLPAIIRDLEAEGYVGRKLIDQRVDVIKRALGDVFQVYMKDQIAKRMNELNAQVDTPAEYDRVAKLLKICDIKAQQQRARK